MSHTQIAATPLLYPTAIVIFGGTGDLAKTKLFPALMDLFVAAQLPKNFTIIGLSRKELSAQNYQDFVKESIAATSHAHTEAQVDEFCTHVTYVAGSFDELAAYERVKVALEQFDTAIGQCTNKLFYLAVPPQYYEVIFEQLSASDSLALCDDRDSWARLLVEKPFGRDLATAQALEKKLCALFRDEQIYRIDHYLAKDAIENIVALRFVNSVLADSWHGRAIESIHITLREAKDVSNRGSFYDALGTLRDVGQNHLLQIFALLTMPTVNVHDAQAIRAARAEALAALAACTPTHIVRGQYVGYEQTAGVAAGSDTETYFRLNFTLAGEVWQDTEFTLEAGKALNRQVNEAVVTFRSAGTCHCTAEAGPHEHKNVLRIQFAPEEQMSLTMWTKQPGFDFVLREQTLTLIERPGEESASPEAYEQVLFDCIMGDQTRFVSGAEVESAWRFITPILEQFKTIPLERYAHGSVGPTTDH